MSKKVAFCINDLSLAGAENIIFNVFINLLDSNKISEESMLVLLNDKIDDLFLSQIKSRNIKIHVISKKKRNLFWFSFLETFVQSMFFFRKNRFDTIYVNLFPSLFIISLLNKMRTIRGSKLIFTEHSVSNNRPKNAIYRYIEKLIYEEYDVIICISENVKSSLERRIGCKSNIKIVRNGLPPMIINNSKSVDIRSELNIPNDSILLLMTSRIGDGKDHMTLLKAFEYIFREDLYLLYIGGGDFSHIISSIISEKIKKNIKFLGKRNDARKIMREVDINILSSAYEGVSGVTLEAFDAKKPFIGSNVDGIRDLVGTSQCLFEFGNKFELSDKILMILQSQEISNQIVYQNSKRLKNYDFQHQLDEILKIL